MEPGVSAIQDAALRAEVGNALDQTLVYGQGTTATRRYRTTAERILTEALQDLLGDYADVVKAA
jgi:hypothetical protein